ncbi:MAG: hypothetical protein FH753_10280 [Firmicutes bacterium]|nr:hypothetical protein [Bacillota bacterium]
MKQLEVEKFHGIIEIDETNIMYSDKDKKKIKSRKPRNFVSYQNIPTLFTNTSKFKGLLHILYCYI